MSEIETLYPIKKSNKKKYKIIALIIVILLIGVFLIIKINNLGKKDNAKTKSNKEQEQIEKLNPEKNNEIIELDEIAPKKVEYLCEKESKYLILENNINYNNKHRYNFIYNIEKNEVVLASYNVDYIFNNLNDYNNVLELPIIFKDKFYEEKFDEEKLTKTLMFYYKLEYQNVSSNDLNSYLRALSNDKFICKIVQNEE